MNKKILKLFISITFSSALTNSCLPSSESEQINPSSSSSSSSEGSSVQTPHDNALESFYRERVDFSGFAIRTKKTVITHLPSFTIDDVVHMYNNSNTPFISFAEDVGNPQRCAEFATHLRAYDNMDSELKKKLKLYDYGIFIVDEGDLRIVLAGVYNIYSPDEDGWSTTRFMLKEQFRRKGLGKEVKKGITDSIRDLIGQKVMVMKYITDYEEKGALFVKHPSKPDRVIPNEGACACLEKSSIEFKGLQGWVHEGNIASIGLNEACGWKRVREEQKADLKRNTANYSLYRYDGTN